MTKNETINSADLASGLRKQKLSTVKTLHLLCRHGNHSENTFIFI